MTKTYSWQKRFRVKLGGRARLELRQPEGFSRPMYWYLGYCPTHGYFEDHLHGFEPDEYLICAKCLAIEKSGPLAKKPK